jgi:uncharacterized membrane protein YraQ (UPF0718 family)
MQGVVGTGLGKRAGLCAIFLIAVAIYFWTQSRYPQINDKALMGGAIELQDSLSFEAKYQIDQGWPLWKQVGYSTINWVYTNRRGMLFGVIFGAAFLTLLRYLPRKSFKSGFANALTGFVIGAPLGVCVNCASPVGFGLYKGGTRAETTLAAMIASPTFNIIVLTMVFSLFPLYMAVTKVVLTLAVILIAIPLIARLMPASEKQVSAADACLINPPTPAKPTENIAMAVAGFVSDYLRDFWFLVRMTVPLMFVAGFLGAVVATLIPFADLADIPVNFLTLLGAALIGVFAPVPMAFDVILSAVLLSAGVPVALVMTLLFTLGIFSVYSYIVIGRTLSLRTASLLTATIVVLGVVAGYAASGIHGYELKKTLKAIQSFVIERLDMSAHAEEAAGGGAISVTSVPFKPRSAPLNGATTLFTRIEAHHIGIDRPNRFSFARMFNPFQDTPGSIAAVDFDHDGDQDVVMALLDSGMKLFLNDGSGHFTEAPSPLPDLDTVALLHAVPVDLNNDGFEDLAVFTERDGVFIYRSDQGKFSAERRTPVANTPDAVLPLVVGFGDVNRDGFLDMAIGNHMFNSGAGWATDERDRNRIVLNDGGKLTGEKYVETPGEPGETLSILLSDFNQDGSLDLVEANDWDQADVFSLGDGKGGLKRITRADGIIPHTTGTTMSIKTADFDNDGAMEMYLSQITGRSDGVRDRLTVADFDDYCDGIEREDDKAKCQRNVNIRRWYRTPDFFTDPRKADRCDDFNDFYAKECRESVIRDIAVQTFDPSLCDAIPDEASPIRRECSVLARNKRGAATEPAETAIPQVKDSNVLLKRNADGTFADVTKKAGVGVGGWSWDVKVFDFDSDELQDLFILNGFWGNAQLIPSKIYYRNSGGLTFKEMTKDAGVVDFQIIPSAAAADYDGDGDIDMIASSVNGPIIAYVNNGQDGHAIAFKLRDGTGNRFGIGSKVTITYGDDGRKQMRELQLSGGFTAFDAPVAHFGLGKVEEVKTVSVEWSTGETSEVAGPFKADATYTISRGLPATN